MTLLPSIPFAQPLPLLASATTSDPFQLAKELWNPEVQANPELLRAQLDNSISSDIFPVGRDEILHYMGQQHPRAVVTGIHQRYEEGQILSLFELHKAATILTDRSRWFDLFDIMALVLGSIANGFLWVGSSKLGIDEYTSLIAVSQLSIMLVVGARVIPRVRRQTSPETWQAELARMSDITLMYGAAKMAAYEGSRELENHFNALAARHLYHMGLSGGNLAKKASNKLYFLAHSKGSLHAHHYNRLLIKQGYANNAPFAFDHSSIDKELAGNETSRDINLIGAMTSKRFRKACSNYLESSKQQLPESLRRAAEIVFPTQHLFP